MATNKDLNRAKDAKEDEYYTLLDEIENEMRHYKEHFKGKTVLCNCDDPYESNFFKYFAMNFNHLGLKKLITTCYVSSPVMYTQLALFEDMQQTFEKPTNPNKKPYKVEITEVADENDDGAFDLDDIKQLLKSKKNVCTILKGDGDFSSDECVKLLKEADIVVTNPPFSLFRNYFALLMEHKKKFIILAPNNALHYKEIFPYIKENKVWMGYKSMSKDMLFDVSPALAESLVKNKKEGSGYRIKNGKVLGRAPAIWLTNLDIEKRHEEMILYKPYSPADYPEYYNFDGIDVNSVADIPCDYYGYMGVPDSFLEQYNPDQFELIGLGTDVEKNKEHISYKDKNLITYEVNGVVVWSTEYSVPERKAGNSLRINENGQPGKLPYSRVIIRRKEQPQ